MYQLGLIGKSLKHSFSKNYFKEKFEQEKLNQFQYDNFELENIEDVEALFTMKNLIGFNVTIPYKKTIIPYLDELDIAAKAIGAVNVVAIENGIKKGYNTDWIGFNQSITPFLPSGLHHALIIGHGGAAQAVEYGLKQLGISVHFLTRNPQQGIVNEELDQTLFETYTIIINCTPIGMNPNIQELPLSDKLNFLKSQVFIDLIYNPQETLFLQKAVKSGAIAINGLKMLEIQAEESWQIWRRLCAY